MTKTIYLDNAATTQIHPKVLNIIQKNLSQNYGNPSSTHTLGQQAKQILEKSRKTIAKSINCSPQEIIFTSSGTESNNLAIKGLTNPSTPLKKTQKKNHIITTQIEHNSILAPCKYLEKQGFKVTYLPVNSEGFISPKDLQKAITKRTLLISIIHANNEIGTIQDIEAIGKIAKSFSVPLHIDACQSYTKIPINVKKQNLSLLTINSHKIHGPKGVAALYIKKSLQSSLSPLLHGGEQEFNLRSSTENVPLIAGFAEASQLPSPNKTLQLKNKIFFQLSLLPKVKFNTPKQSLPNIINITFPNLTAELLGSYLDQRDILISTSSACNEQTNSPSHVLKAIGLSPKQIKNSIRISLSQFNTEKDVSLLIKAITNLSNKFK